jgi:hypothetical protein
MSALVLVAVCIAVVLTASERRPDVLVEVSASTDLTRIPPLISVLLVILPAIRIMSNENTGNVKDRFIVHICHAA